MINVQDLDFKSLTRTRRVNGERTIELDIYPTSKNIAYFDLVVEEAILTFDGDEYVIKKLNEKSIGKTYWKQVTAIHKFYVDLINKQQPRIHNGSITFQNYMNMVFEGTPYANFEVVDQFLARSFENLGNDNRVALMQKGLERFKAELELVGSGYKPRLKEMIGEDTDAQFRYGHNVKAVSKEIDTTNLATKISGTGDPELGIKASYTSPNVAIFGEIDAPPVDDERFKSEEALLDEMKSRLQDTPKVSITVDFVDLRASGYPYHVPNEGDRIWLIYEPMDDLLIETRILEIKERFDINLRPIETETTLSNHKKTFAGTMFDNIQKQLSQIVNDDGVVKYNVLDEAVKIATEALHSAQTELEFNNGIIAREKTNANRLVILNSGGLGISKDGGRTFTEAITADGFVLSAGAIGRLSANNITIGEGSQFDEGYDPTKIEIDTTNLISNSKGDTLSGWSNWGTTNTVLTDYLGHEWIWVRRTTGNQVGIHTPVFDLKADQTYTVSFTIRSRSNSGYDLNYLYLRQGTNTISTIKSLPNVSMSDPKFEGDIAGDGLRVWFTFSHDEDLDNARLLLAIADRPENAGFVIREVKIEKGDKVTDWTPAYEDSISYTDALISENRGVWDRASAFDANGDLDTDYLKGAIDVTKNKITQSSRFYWDADGLVAVDPTNSNKIVKYTSGGIGISTNGGSSYQTAVTADGIIGIDIIGTNIMSFDPATNDVITLENGEITTFEGGKQRFGIYGNGLVAYHWETEREVATFRASHINNEQYGASIIGWEDYLGLGRHVGGGTGRFQLAFYWDGDYDRTILYGGSGTRDSGHLMLRSTYSGGTAGSRVPHLIIDNRTSSGTTYSGARFYVGRDNKSPSGSNFRSGFEVWQYEGDGQGGLDLLFDIDTNTSNESYIDAWVDLFYIKGHLRANSGLTASEKSHIYADLDMHNWDILNVGDIAVNRLRANETSGRFIELYNNTITTNNVEYTGVSLRRFDGLGGIHFHKDHGMLTGGVEGKFGVLRVGSDSTSALVQSVDIYHRTYTATSQMVRVTQNGILGMSTSSRRYKINEKVIGLEYAKRIHDINAVSWYDKRSAEDYCHTLSTGEETEVQKVVRIGGVIAEDTHDAGLEMYVNYDDKNRPHGVSSFMWTLLIPISKDHEDRLNEYDDRFGTLENRIDKLEREMNKLKGVA